VIRFFRKSPQTQLNTKRRRSRTDENAAVVLFSVPKCWPVAWDELKSKCYASLWIFPRTSCGEHHAVPGHTICGPSVRCRPFISTMQFHWSTHTALVNVALVFRNLPYLSLAHMMQLNLEHRVISKHWNSLQIFHFNFLLLKSSCQKIVWQRTVPHARADEFYRSLHQCCTPRKYLQEGKTPSSLCEWINLRNYLASEICLSTFTEVRLLPQLKQSNINSIIS